MIPRLDDWLPDPAVRVAHARQSNTSAEELWEAARAVRVGDTGLLARLIRWRIPGTPSELPFDALFRQPPFTLVSEEDGALLSGLVGRIWTLRRDYPRLSDPEEFRQWSAGGTAKVLFATWVEPGADRRTALRAEVRLQVFGAQGRLGLAAVRPLIGGFHHLVGSEGIAAAVRHAEGQGSVSSPTG